MFSVRIMSFAAAAAFCCGIASAQVDRLYSVSSASGLLRSITLVYASTMSSVPIVRSTGGNANGCDGLARNASTGQVWVIARFSGGPQQHLCTLDIGTGIATVVGPLADSFASLACRADGVLFGVTSDSASVPETLWSIDPTTAQATLVTTLGNGSDGEAIAFAPDGFLYHASGNGVPGVDEVFERIDTTTASVTNVPLSGQDYAGLTVLLSYTGRNLIGVATNDAIHVITTAGHVSDFATLDHAAVTGLVFVPAVAEPFFRQYGDGCETGEGAIPILIGCGYPSGGHNPSMHLDHAPPGTLGVLALGDGNGTLAFPSVACQAQVLPVFYVEGILVDVLGAHTRTFPLPVGIGALDVFCQYAVVDGAQILVSNPVHMHVQ